MSDARRGGGGGGGGLEAGGEEERIKRVYTVLRERAYRWWESACAHVAETIKD